MEVVLSIAIVGLIAILLVLEAERRKAIAEKGKSEVHQYLLDAEIERLREEQEALKDSLERAHHRLNELAHERDVLGFGDGSKKGNGS